jgi:endonuclease YncB( thermonuclease family)
VLAFVFLPLFAFAAIVNGCDDTASAAQRPTPTKVPGTSITVIDGDTIRWRGEKIRLTGFDAPDIYPGHYKCEKERQLGLKAKDKLVSILNPRNNPQIAYSRSGKNPAKDNYGRRLATVTTVVARRQQDIAVQMIAAKVAVAWKGGKRNSWCR